MEGIRRISIIVKAIACIWFLAFIVAAGVDVVGHDIPMTRDQMQAEYERSTGRSLQADAEQAIRANAASDDPVVKLIEQENQSSAPKLSMLQTLDVAGAVGDAENKIITRFFEGSSTTIRQRDWDSGETGAVTAVIGGAVFWALGWIIAGFAVKRGR